MMCDALNETTLDGASKTSEWLLKNNFDQTSISSEEMTDKDSEVKRGRFTRKSSALNGDISRNYRKHGRKGKKRLHTNSRVGANDVERFNNTAALLRCSGLLQITKSISQLVNDNQKLQNEIDKLQQETTDHSRQLRKQLQKKLEAENETSGSCNPDGHKLLTKLSQSLLQWD